MSAEIVPPLLLQMQSGRYRRFTSVYAAHLPKLYGRLDTSPKYKRPPKEVTRLVKAAKRTMARWARRPYETDEVRRFGAKIRNGTDHWFSFSPPPTTEQAEPSENMWFGTPKPERDILQLALSFLSGTMEPRSEQLSGGV